MSQTLSEMDDGAFCTKMDELLEELERHIEGQIGGLTIATFKSEIRRRVLGRQGTAARMSSVTVGVDKMYFAPNSLPVFSAFSGAGVRGIYYRFRFDGGDSAASIPPIGFFTKIEAQAFVLGLKTAQASGLPFRSIPEVEEAQ